MRRSGWWIYFVQGEHSQNIKIGIATCPYRRVETLQAHCTERLVILSIARIVSGDTQEAARDAEAIIHRRFEAQRLYSEMFASSPELLKLAGLKRTGPAHKCPRCPAIAPPSGDPPKRRAAVSISSKVRHNEKRLLKRPKTRSLYHQKLPRTFFPRRDRD